MSDASTHLHRGPFAPERKAAADRQDATDEFYDHGRKCFARPSDFQFAFDARDSAPRSLRSKTKDQPSGKSAHQRSRAHDQRNTHPTQGVRATKEVSPPRVRSNQQNAERRSRQTRERTHKN